MLDVLNEKLTKEGKEPVAFDHDCREGICGMCGAVVNGIAHGPEKETTLCQLHMRNFRSGDTLVIEPFRSRAFPIRKDLMVDRSALDRIIQSGGYVSVNTGGTPDANAHPHPVGDGRTGHGRRGLHRLRGLCRQLPERGGHALHRRQDLSALPAPPGPAGTASSGPWPWSRPWTGRGSATAPTPGNARRSVRKAYPSAISPVSIGNFLPPAFWKAKVALSGTRCRHL